jgi:hypothetical protein
MDRVGLIVLCRDVNCACAGGQGGFDSAAQGCELCACAGGQGGFDSAAQGCELLIKTIGMTKLFNFE